VTAIRPAAALPDTRAYPRGRRRRVAFVDQGNNTRQEHQITNLITGLHIVTHGVANHAGDFLPFRSRSFDERVEVIY